MASVQPSVSRATRTRAALLAAGFKLLVDRPIDAIPIDDFVAEAGVAKGSFFNHFADKHAFAEAIATEVRLELEARVALANADLDDPVARIAGGMRVCADFALTKPTRTIVLLRSHALSTARAHPLNRGLGDDVDAACQRGQLRPEAHVSGVLYWMGLCQILMANLVERQLSDADAARRVNDMTVLGLTGLGISLPEAMALAGAGKARGQPLFQAG